MASESHFPTDEPRIIDEPATWLEEHRTLVLGVVALVILAAGAAVFWWHARETNAALASARLMEAKETVDFQKIVGEFPRTPAAPLALMRLAQLARETSDWEGALAHTDRFLKDYPRHPFFPAMQLSRAETLEAAGRADEAMQAYERVHDARPVHPFLGGAVLGMARIHQAAGNQAAARTVLSDFLATDRSGVYASEVSQMLKKLPTPAEPAPAQN